MQAVRQDLISSHSLDSEEFDPTTSTKHTQRSKMKFKLATLVLTLAMTTLSFANAVTYTGSQGTLSASATLSQTGTMLQIMLKNTSTHDVLVPTDVLTGVLFNSPTLTPVSASLVGTTEYGSSTNFGDGWGYAHISALTFTNAIEATGAVAGLGHSNFSANHTNLQGLAYGIVSAGDNPLTGNGGVTGKGPLAKAEVDFTLTTPAGFKLSDLGNTVEFVYGTSLNDTKFNGRLDPTPTPEPGTLIMLGSGIIGLAGVLRRKINL